jgi:DMSO/TMAO reductase YedYZ molybdopterin-dependent catalytic subunit
MQRPPKKNSKAFGPEYMTHHLEVTGLVNRPQRLTVAELREMAPAEIQNLQMVCESGPHEGRSSYRGVLLTAILDKADIIMREYDSPGWIYITVTSSDGHWVLFSYQELYNSPVGDQAVVVVERNGQPLGEHEGEIAFISANDKIPGPRKMRYLQRIQVHEHIPAANMS